MLLDRHRAIMWYTFGGGLAKFPGSGVVVKSNCFVLDCGFEEFLYRGLSLFFSFFQSSSSPSN